MFWIKNVAPKRKTQNLVVSCHVYLCCHPKGRDYLELVQVYMYWRSPTNENSLYVCKAIYSNLCKISATKRSWRAGSWLLTYALRSIQSADSVKCVIKNHVTVILPISMILCSRIVRHCRSRPVVDQSPAYCTEKFPIRIRSRSHAIEPLQSKQTTQRRCLNYNNFI